jgi:pyruvate dehydrogenase E2 component (dihydrolipoamide acetyltransferase)
MPALGADMETGQVVQWLVQPGDRVRSGDVVAVVETHKGAIDVECFLDGVIDDLAPLGQALPVGAVLAHVRTAQASAPPMAAAVPAAPGAASAAVPSCAPPAASIAATMAAARSAVAVKASPAARRRAQELGLDVAALQGRGAGGVVTLADVHKAAEPGVAVRSPARGFDPVQMREAIAAAMSRSKREIPHYYLGSTMDFQLAQTWLDTYNQAQADPAARLLPALLLLKATALALKEAPQLNGFFEAGRFRAGAGIHIGWAIALRGGGLVAPALHHVDQQPLPTLMQSLRDLVQRARTGGLRSSELTDPTITVTSLGERGAHSVLGVIYPPQVAIVGFGRIEPRPSVVDGRLEVRSLVEATLAADHRASDGHVGGQLLAAIERALRSPHSL